MAAFGAFAAGFLARPFGGLIFGYIGDRKSRSTAFWLGQHFYGCADSWGSAVAILCFDRDTRTIDASSFKSNTGYCNWWSVHRVILIEAETTVAGKTKASASVIASAYVGMLLAAVSISSN